MKFIKFNTKRCFGIELEVDNNKTLESLVEVVTSNDKVKRCHSSRSYVQDYSNDYWNVKFDRSCGSVVNEGGWEIASYKAVGTRDLSKVANMATALSKSGAKINKNCGFHIHVEIADFSKEKVAVLLQNWLQLENFFINVLPADRKNNKYCKFLRSIIDLPNNKTLESPYKLFDYLKPKDNTPEERRVAINLSNYCFSDISKKTVEFRMPEGTLSEKDVKNWTRLLIHFVNTCRFREYKPNIQSLESLDQILIALGLKFEKEVSILSTGLYETLNWLLHRLIENSANKALVEQASEMSKIILPLEENHRVVLPQIKNKPVKEANK